jgi:hypothetical protein
MPRRCTELVVKSCRLVSEIGKVRGGDRVAEQEVSWLLTLV